LFCYYAYPANKAEKFHEIISNCQTMSNYEQSSAMSGWSSSHDESVLTDCLDLFFTEFRRVLNDTPKEFSTRYAESMVPFFGNEELVISKIDLLLDGLEQSEYPAIFKQLNESIDVLERISRGKRKSEEYLAATS
jgi:hypothetical protein